MKNKKIREDFYFELISLLDTLEEKFIKRLNKFFNKIINTLLKKADSLISIKNTLKDFVSNPNEFKNMLKKYYKEIGKVSVKQLNKEIKTLSGKGSKIKIYDNNENLRLKAEKLALKKVNDVKKIVLKKINNLEDKTDKNLLKKAIKSAHNVLQNRHIKVIARNESTYSANQARIDAIQKSTICKGYQFLAVIDKRTTQICSKRHNHVFKLDSPYLKMYTPPLHHNCRSLLSPVTIFEDIPYTPIETLKNVPPAEFKKKIK